MSGGVLVFSGLVFTAAWGLSRSLLQGIRNAALFEWISGAGSRKAGVSKSGDIIAFGRRILAKAGEAQERVPVVARFSRAINGPLGRMLGEDDPGSAFLLAAREAVFVLAAGFFSWLAADWMIGSAIGVAAVFIPDFLARSRHRARAARVARELPDVLDLMTISLEAGLSLDAAFQETARQYRGGTISAAVSRMQGEIRFGAKRHEAWRRMAARLGSPGMAEIVSALVQADSMGVSLANAIYNMSGQMRVKRRLEVEEAAHKAPVKMLFPLAFFIFPAIFLVLLGPVFLQLVEILG